MRSFRSFLAISLTLSLLLKTCLAAVPIAWATVEENDMAIIAQGNNEFALDLYKRLCTEEGNLFLSPYSISTALAVAYAGAKGETESQMAKVLRFTLEGELHHAAFASLINALNAEGEKGAFQLSVANAIWGQKGYEFLREFLKLVKTNYAAEIKTVNFAEATEDARKTINDWVEKKTEGKIVELIKPGAVDRLTRFVLTNAIYFKGRWVSQFNKDSTADAPFAVTEDNKLNVPMMQQKGNYKYVETETLQALELPYEGESLSMIVLLPKDISGLQELEKNLTLGNLNTWLGGLKQQEVKVSLPRFKTTSEFMLGDTLKSMGMTDAFTPVADFSGMTGKKDISISEVIHKAFVEVNEEGTEAAAATGIVMKGTMVQEVPVFRADHPFIFMIRHNPSASILFVGRLTNPLP